MAEGDYIGRSVARLEDRPLLKGEGRFAADINFPGQWSMRVARPHNAHVQLVRERDVAGIASVAGDERAVLDARDRVAEDLPLLRARRGLEIVAHAGSLARRMSAATARTAAMMF